MILRLPPDVPTPPPEIDGLLNRWLSADLIGPAEPRRLVIGGYMARATGEQEFGPLGVADVFELVEP